MTKPADEIPDRRPIAARRLGAIRWMASSLANRKISPNAISTLGMMTACAAGLCLALTAQAGMPIRILMLCAAVGVQLRLLANLLDGMVAVEGGLRSAVGDLYNEVPDRISDTAVLVGAGYAVGSVDWLGYLAACGALFVTYLRTLGRSLGFASDYRGPMAKQQRMFLITVATLYVAIVPEAWWPGFVIWNGGPAVGALALVLVLIVLGEIATAWRRLAGIAKQLRNRPL